MAREKEEGTRSKQSLKEDRKKRRGSEIEMKEKKWGTRKTRKVKRKANK